MQAARACEACGEFEQGLEHLEPLFENAQANTQILVLRARLRQQTGDYVGELSDLERIRDLAPANLVVGERQVRCRASAGQLSQALSLVTELLDVSKTRQPELKKLWAELFARLECHDDAIADYTQLATFQAHRQSAVREWARLHLVSRNWDRAAEDLTELLAKDPTNSTLHMQRATAYEESNQLEAAVSDLSMALEFDSANVKILFRRGCLHQKVGLSRNAEKISCESVLSNRSVPALANIWRGCCWNNGSISGYWTSFAGFRHSCRTRLNCIICVPRNHLLDRIGSERLSTRLRHCDTRDSAGPAGPRQGGGFR